MEIKHLDFRTDIKTDSNNSNNTFEAYASTFGNVDLHDDVIVKGAFAETIKKRTPKLAYQHDITKLVGVVKAIQEDDTGLLIRGEFLNTPLGKQVYEEVKAGAITQMSIGFATNESEYDMRGVRLIKSVELYEVSFVTFPANEKAIVTAVKADGITTIREFENFLRDAGFSRKQAKRIASHGFATTDDIERDALIDEVKNDIENLTKKIRGSNGLTRN